MKRQLQRFATPIALSLGVALAGCQSGAADDDPTTSAIVPTATPTAEASAATESVSAEPTDGNGEETSVFDLAIGDCFSASGESVGSVTVVGCDRTHIYEVFAVLDHEGGDDADYPGDDSMLEYADAACQPPFEEYVGTDYNDSRYWITSVTPSQETWDEGDREIVCTLKVGEDGSETTGSAEGTQE